MKKLLLLVTAVVFMTSLMKAQIQMSSNGKVGIGKQPDSQYSLSTYNIYLSNGPYVGLIMSDHPSIAYVKAIWPTYDYQGYLGLPDKRFQYVYCQTLVQGSDKRDKENIQNINNALNVILKLKGVKYDFKKEVAYNDSLIKDSKIKTRLELERKNKLGFLAQDVQEVLPEVVNYSDSTDSYGIEYTALIPVLVEAVKEQQIIIESLQTEIQELTKGNSGSKLKSATTATSTSSSQANTLNALYQNTPNPFSQSTTIEYSVAENIQKAMICIYDMNGTQLKCIALSLTGYGNITINGSELKAGMYMYSLIADGQLIDTKRMVLTD